MGGAGSGRRIKSKSLVEDQTRVNIHKWRRLLVNGSFFEWNMWAEHELYWPAAVKVCDNNTLTVTYELNNANGREIVANIVSIDWSQIPLGRRVWFVCPGCGRRVVDLYLVDKYLLCRHCNRLGYQSQRK